MKTLKVFINLCGCQLILMNKAPDLVIPKNSKLESFSSLHQSSDSGPVWEIYNAAFSYTAARPLLNEVIKENFR